MEAQGTEVKPDWPLILRYEYQVCKEALQRVLYESNTLAEALEAVRGDTEHRERFFTTPVLAEIVAKSINNQMSIPGKQSYGAGKGFQDYRSQPYQQKGKDGRGKGKFAGKGKKGKEKHEQFYKSWTPEGKPICYA